MSKRLHVSLSDREFEQLKSVARGQGVSVSEWVRRAIQASFGSYEVGPAETKLAAIQRPLEYDFPTGDIGQMNREIKAGRGTGLP